MEDVEKDIIPVSSNKRESFLGLYTSFPWGYRGKNMIHYYLIAKKYWWLWRKKQRY